MKQRKKKGDDDATGTAHAQPTPGGDWMKQMQSAMPQMYGMFQQMWTARMQVTTARKEPDALV